MHPHLDRFASFEPVARILLANVHVQATSLGLELGHGGLISYQIAAQTASCIRNKTGVYEGSPLSR